METPREKVIHRDHRDHIDHSATHLKRVSWPAIFAGTIIMLVTLMMLSLLGMGIGLTSINPMEESEPLQGIGTGAIIWWVVSNLAAIFAGAYVAANLTTLSYKLTGAYHGVLTWALYTLISFWLMTTAVGGIIGGAGSILGKSFSAFGSGISELVSAAEEGQFNNERINQMIQQALQRDQQQAGDTAEFDIDVMAVVQDVFMENGELKADVSQQELEESVARNSTLAQQDVSRAADVIMKEYQRLEQQWQQLKQKAEEAAQQASDAVGKAAIWAFVALVLGLMAAAAGGMAGKPDVDEVTDRRKAV